MSNVTYLFGAGASAGNDTLPVVKAVPARMLEFYQWINSSSYDLATEQAQRALKNDIDWLVKQIDKHSSIDTFAKKLYINRHVRTPQIPYLDDLELRKLKIVTSLFFTFLQSVKNVDKRYDSFFASIIRNSPSELPKTIKIASWNYDSQFEISFREFTGISNLLEVQAKLGVVTKFLTKQENVKDEFSIFKINGTASSYRNGKDIINLFSDSSFSVSHCLQKYIELSSDRSCYSNLSFAWEDEQNDGPGERVFMTAAKSLKNTEVLVVIGYSFPFFNREIDSAIFGEEAMPKLSKVYFQSLEPNVIRGRFTALRSDIRDLVEYRDVSEFLLPMELSI